MALVKSEVAPEFSVVTAWVSALLPWSVTVAWGQIAGGSLIQFHFPALLIRFLLEVDVPGPNPLFLLPWESVGYYQAAPGPVAFAVYTIGTGFVLASLVLSFVVYLNDDQLDEFAYDPVRVMGVLLGGAAVTFTVSALLLQFGIPFVSSVSGIPFLPSGAATPFVGFVVPIGVLFQYFFAYALLTVDRDAAGTTA